jgi:Zn ribbon nucleic-acid-binding protein
LAPSKCGECELPLRWEQIPDERAERWLAVCACGRPWAYFPGRAGYQPEDPLAEALGWATANGTSPPWIRLFQLTSGYPWWLPWRHVARGCPGCAQQVTFAVWTRPRRDRWAHSSLCLACGHATSEYICVMNRGMSEAPVSGREWSPACVAVARLRRAVFSAPWAG